MASWTESILDWSKDNADLIMKTADEFITTPAEAREQERAIESYKTEQKKAEAEIRQAQAQAETVQNLVVGLGGLGLVGLLVYLFFG